MPEKNRKVKRVRVPEAEIQWLEMSKWTLTQEIMALDLGGGGV